MLMYDNEFKTKENKIWTKDKIEPQHINPPKPRNILREEGRGLIVDLQPTSEMRK